MLFFLLLYSPFENVVVCSNFSLCHKGKWPKWNVTRIMCEYAAHTHTHTHTKCSCIFRRKCTLVHLCWEIYLLSISEYSPDAFCVGHHRTVLMHTQHKSERCLCMAWLFAFRHHFDLFFISSFVCASHCDNGTVLLLTNLSTYKMVNFQRYTLMLIERTMTKTGAMDINRAGAIYRIYCWKKYSPIWTCANAITLVWLVLRVYIYCMTIEIITSTNMGGMINSFLLQVCRNWYTAFYLPRVWNDFIVDDRTLTRAKFNYYSGWQYVLDHLRTQYCLQRVGPMIRGLDFRPIYSFNNLFQFMTLIAWCMEQVGRQKNTQMFHSRTQPN